MPYVVQVSLYDTIFVKMALLSCFVENEWGRMGLISCYMQMDISCLMICSFGFDDTELKIA